MRTKDWEVTTFIDKCLQKFPDDPFLLEMRSMCFMRLKDTKGAIHFLKEALKKHPNNVRFLYWLATCYSMDEDRFNDGGQMLIKAWDDFLQVAPKDHQKVPAAYYRKAMAYIQ